MPLFSGSESCFVLLWPVPDTVSIAHTGWCQMVQSQQGLMGKSRHATSLRCWQRGSRSRSWLLWSLCGTRVSPTQPNSPSPLPQPSPQFPFLPTSTPPPPKDSRQLLGSDYLSCLRCHTSQGMCGDCQSEDCAVSWARFLHPSASGAHLLDK